MLDFAQARRIMVDSQLRTYDVTDRAVLLAMGEVPRERFALPGREVLAYSDLGADLSGGGGGPVRVMLAPMVLARLIQALEIQPGSRVLDVASGLGYASAVLARLGGTVVAVESDESLAAQARANPLLAGISIVVGPVLAGHAPSGPFDAILINGAVTSRPDTLLSQLADGGRLGCVLQGEGPSRAVVYVKSDEACGMRALFDTAAPTVEGAAREASFVF